VSDRPEIEVRLQDDPTEISVPVPEILVFGMSGGFVGATINMAVDPSASSLGRQFQTQLVISPTQDGLNTRVLATLIQEYGLSQADAEALVPFAMKPMVPAAGDTDDIPEAPQDGFSYGRMNATWAQVLPLTGGVLGGPVQVPGGSPVAAALAMGAPDFGFYSIGSTIFTLFGQANSGPSFTVNGITTRGLDLGGTGRITNLGTPVNPADGANKGYVDNAVAGGEAAVVSSFNTRTGAVTLSSSDVVTALTFTPYNATNPAGYVTSAQAASAAPVQSFNTRTGTVTLGNTDVTAALGFTPYNATNPSGYQTAAQVTTALGPYALTSSVPVGSNTQPSMDGTSSAGTGAAWSRSDHTHPSDTSRMPIAGVTNGSNAAAGQIGEFLSAICLQANAINLTTGTDTVIATLPLTAGDWDVWGSVTFNMTNGNTVTVRGWISQTTTQPSFDQLGGNAILPMPNNVPLASLVVTQLRVNSNTGVSITLGATASFSGTITAFGKVMARRVR
jgi:hypothetical protein